MVPACQLTRVDEVVHQHHLQHCPAAQLRQPARSITSSAFYLGLEFQAQGGDNASLWKSIGQATPHLDLKVERPGSAT